MEQIPRCLAQGLGQPAGSSPQPCSWPPVVRECQELLVPAPPPHPWQGSSEMTGGYRGATRGLAASNGPDPPQNGSGGNERPLSPPPCEEPATGGHPLRRLPGRGGGKTLRDGAVPGVQRCHPARRLPPFLLPPSLTAGLSRWWRRRRWRCGERPPSVAACVRNGAAAILAAGSASGARRGGLGGGPEAAAAAPAPPWRCRPTCRPCRSCSGPTRGAASSRLTAPRCTRWPGAAAAAAWPPALSIRRPASSCSRRTGW